MGIPIRTRMQGDTPFFPNMLNNGAVEVCLKEDVDRVLAEKDAEILKWKTARDNCEQQFQEKVEEISELISEVNELRQQNAGCHYCNDGEPLWKSCLESVVIGKNPQTRNPSIKLGHSLSIPIEYCPKCGRKL